MSSRAGTLFIALLVSTSLAEAQQVDATHLHVGRIARMGTEEQGEKTKEQGERVQELSRGSYRGRPAIISMQRFPVADGVAIDSSMADARTMVPFRHVGIHPSHTMVLDFDGAHVTGKYAPKTGAAIQIDHRMAAKPYDSGIFDLVIASLPLAEGYTVHLPFYIYEKGGLVWWDVHVTGNETLQLRDGSRAEAWVVETLDGTRVFSRLWISRNGEREVLRTRYFVGPEHSFTNTR